MRGSDLIARWCTGASTEERPRSEATRWKEIDGKWKLMDNEVKWVNSSTRGQLRQQMDIKSFLELFRVFSV